MNRFHARRGSGGTDRAHRWLTGAPRIAVIADDCAARDFIHSILLDGGYQPLLAAEAHGALERLAQHPPDGILLDLRLRSAESYVIILALLRMMPSLCAVPVIVCVSRELAPTAALQITTLGCTFLFTPFTADDVLIHLHMALDDHLLPGMVAER
jgi:two-component system response regulator MprA